MDAQLRVPHAPGAAASCVPGGRHQHPCCPPQRLAAYLGGAAVDGDLLDELEEILFTADLGVQTAESLLERVRSEGRGEDGAKVREILKGAIAEKLAASGAVLHLTARSADKGKKVTRCAVNRVVPRYCSSLPLCRV